MSINIRKAIVTYTVLFLIIKLALFLFFLAIIWADYKNNYSRNHAVQIEESKKHKFKENWSKQGQWLPQFWCWSKHMLRLY